ncbi:hypothetical protein BBP40_006069 [Aspergillus hancockii]|nr:hypothetical protein BBP40_006069 [Aspergillus hancockii]
MIEATGRARHHRLIHGLPDLIKSISGFSSVSYQYAAKYSITNFIKTKGFSGSEPATGDLGPLKNDLETVVILEGKDLETMMFCETNDIMFMAHSPSHWMLYGIRTLGKSNYISGLEESVAPFLGRSKQNERHMGASIQVTGPPGHGKSAVVKFIAQEVRQGSPAVPVEHFLAGSISNPPTIYGVHVSFIHQVISQRPPMFWPVEKADGTDAISGGLDGTKSADFLMAIYDFDRWLTNIRLWWSGTLELLLRTCSVKLTSVVSSDHLINGLRSSPAYELQIENVRRQLKDFIRARTDDIIQHIYGSDASRKSRKAKVKEKLIPAAQSFQGSFAAIDAYLAPLLGPSTLSTTDAIDDKIRTSKNDGNRVL